MKLLAALALLAAGTGQALASDNYLAHQLFQEGRHAEAAEIFTDPAWKGVALYRSDQWWRAAEAFVRASDPDSLYNLGNTYARLSYFALALESYQAALVLRPDFPDARHNADIMREMLRRQDEEKKGQAAMTPKQKAIDRVEDDRKEDGGADPQAGDEKGKAEKRQDGQKQEGGKDSRQPAPKAQAQGDSGSAGDGKERQDKEGDGGTSLTGKRGDRDPASRPSGGSQSADATDRSDAAGARAALESGQATEQWLNAIPDDPARFLKRRIALELNRRKAAGNAPDEGQSPW
ncbi:tetratricopeptide repeat protein [Zhengella mangrovi]|uniref:tetratricopeptide repeat protein n=1 Tax=Zhengella mangrovi TaxID=1982044 RepID=UPI0010544307|nr:tetratricopeptide repeat protein [Zhengella mangrovi]